MVVGICTASTDRDQQLPQRAPVMSSDVCLVLGVTCQIVTSLLHDQAVSVTQDIISDHLHVPMCHSVYLTSL